MSLFVCQAAVSGRNRLFSGPLFDIIQVSHRRGRKDRREKGISMKLSEKICACRTAAGLSPETLAERLGVSPETVSLWESGGAEPDLARLRLLAAEFHVSADWLLSDAPLPEAVSRAPALDVRHPCIGAAGGGADPVWAFGAFSARFSMAFRRSLLSVCRFRQPAQPHFHRPLDRRAGAAGRRDRIGCRPVPAAAVSFFGNSENPLDKRIALCYAIFNV